MPEDLSPSATPSYRDEIVTVTPAEVLSELARFFNIDSALTTDEVMTGLFTNAYGQMDPSASRTYQRKIASCDYADYKKTGQLPLYVLTAYKEAKMHFKKMAEQKIPDPGLGFLIKPDTEPNSSS